MSGFVLAEQLYEIEFATEANNTVNLGAYSVICPSFNVDCHNRTTARVHNNSIGPLDFDSTPSTVISRQENCTTHNVTSSLYHSCNNAYSRMNSSSIQDPSYINECSLLSLDDEDLPSDAILKLGMATCVIVGVIGSVGNLITMATLIHQYSLPPLLRNIKTLTADLVLIFNLALCDLFYCSVSLPFMFITYFTVYNKERPWFGHSKLCELSAFFRYTTAICEWMTLGLLALERWMCIHQYRLSAGRSRWFKPRLTIAYCITMWIASVCMQLPTLLSKFGNFSFNSLTFKCDFCNPDRNMINPRILFFTIESMVPCIFIFVGYMAILCQVYNSSQRLIGISTKRTQIAMSLRKSRTIRMILGVLFVYLVCVIPICIYNVMFCHSFQRELGVILYCLYWVQYMANNFIYVVSNDKHRSAYCQLGQFLRGVPIQLPLDTIRHRQLQKLQHQLQAKNCQDQKRGSTQFLPSLVIDGRVRSPSDCEVAAAEDKLQGSLRPVFLIDDNYNTQNNLANVLAQVHHAQANHTPSVDSASLSTSTNNSQVNLLHLSKTYKRSFSFHPNLRKTKKKLKRTFSA
ncbi:uncharacterized protein LOC143035904 [Oratosquilla oratoria]|uniref:uncharacterized protein LOC143035904 n=1 Tax=Oratosquilla oratoria TaxID=337810 RepID=UPI003F767BE6